MASGAAVWTTVVASLAVWRHSEFLSHRFDLGNVTQAVWSTADGRFLEVTLGTGEQASRLAGHVDPALVLFVPLWWIHSDPATLIVAQAAALAAGVYPVVRLGVKYVGSVVPVALLGTWYLVFPWLVWNAVNDVHAVTLAIPFLLYAIWFLDEHHLGRFAVFGVLAMSTGELVGLTVAALGVWYMIRYHRRRAGLLIALGGTAWTTICLVVLIPAFNDGRPSPFYDRFESVGGSPLGLLKTLFADPGAVWAQVTTAADVSYVILLLLPTAFLALGAPLLLAAALPQLGINLLSDWGASTQPTFQYVAPITALLISASIMALGRLPERIRHVGAVALLTAGLGCLALKPPIPGGQGYEEHVFSSIESTARTDAMRAAIDLIPPQAAVTATNRLGAHLSARRAIYQFPQRSASDWMAIDTRDHFVFVGRERADTKLFERLIANLERDVTWRLVFERADVRVYRKTFVKARAEAAG